MFSNKKDSIKSLESMFENAINRAKELNSLLIMRNRPSKAVVTFISSEVKRLKNDLSAFVQMSKFNSASPSLVAEMKVFLSEVIFEVEHKLGRYDDEPSKDLIESLFYPQLLENTRRAKRIEVFAGFEPMQPDDELPEFSYGIKFIFDDETSQNHFFYSSGDGCLVSESANDRRKRSLNVVTAVAEDIIRHVYHDPLDAAKVDVSIRTDMEIQGFYCPDGWSVKNGTNAISEKHYSHSIIPPSYYESLIFKNMFSVLKTDDLLKVRIYSCLTDSDDKAQVSREFGVKFSSNNDVTLDTLVFEKVRLSGEYTQEHFARKMNKIIAIMDQYIFEVFQIVIQGEPLIKLEIEVDFDKQGLSCPANFEFVDPSNQ